MEWADTDEDGIGNNTAPDIDNDEILNLTDAEPLNVGSGSFKLLEIASDTNNDYFGQTIARISDLNADGINDIAVAAPRNINHEAIRSGTVYLFSFADFTALPDLTDESGKRSLQEFRTDTDTWQIHGVQGNEGLGTELMLLEHDPAADRSPELLVAGASSAYLITLDSSVLSNLDAEDGTTDRQIYLANCTHVLSCSRIDGSEEFLLKAYTDVGDLDDDGSTDLGVLGANSAGDQISLYVLNRQGIDD